MSGNKRQMYRRVKGLISLVLAFMLMFGSSLTVFAGERCYAAALEVGDVLDGGDTICDHASGGFRIVLDGEELSGDYYDGDYKVAVKAYDEDGASAELYWSNGATCTLPGSGVQYRVVNKTMDGYAGGPSNIGQLSVRCYTVQLETISSASPKEKKGAGNDKHMHSFNWLITKDPTLEEDGLAEYICECGVVEAKQPVSSAFSFVELVDDSIKNAPEGATVEIRSDKYFCYTAELMESLSKRPDVSLKTTFPSEDGTLRSFTIPAGLAPTDGMEFYGFVGLGNLYGWDEVEEAH